MFLSICKIVLVYYRTLKCLLKSSVTYRPINQFKSGELEIIRTTDIQTDKNSAASQALSAIAQTPTRNKYLSTDLRDTVMRRGSLRTDKVPSPKQKVEGREIMQDHSLYALTYGMMLGIRVLVRRLLIDR